MSNVTDLWLSGVFFQAPNTPKFVFGWGSRLLAPPTQIPVYAYDKHSTPMSGPLWRRTAPFILSPDN